MGINVDDLKCPDANFFILTNPADASQHAVFGFVDVGVWASNSIQTPEKVVLVSSAQWTSEFNLSPFGAGGLFQPLATGVELDSRTHTFSVSDTALFGFTLTASAPEPATAVLLLAAGASGLLVFGTRRLRKPGGLT
jgi:hypothetical protein